MKLHCNVSMEERRDHKSFKTRRESVHVFIKSKYKCYSILLLLKYELY